MAGFQTCTLPICPWKDITSTASSTVSVLTRVSISGRCTTCASSDLASAFRDTFDALEGTAAAGFVLVILLMVRRTRFWPPGVARRRKGEASSAPRSEERRVGKELSVRVDLGGRRIIKKKIKKERQADV